MTSLPFNPRLLRGAPQPLHVQLAGEIRDAALHGRLPAGTRLPGSRSLAQTLGVSRGVVEEAYGLLTSDGTLEAVVGSGTRVAAGLHLHPAPQDSGPGTAPPWFQARTMPHSARLDAREGLHFRSGVTSCAMLDEQAWKRAWARATDLPLPGEYGDLAGLHDLRVALAAFTGRLRGLASTPEQVVLTSGSLNSLGLIARGVLPPRTTVLYENPGYRSGHAVLQAAGHTLVPVPVDADGLVVAGLPPAQAVYVTPSHQFPLGGRMSLARRLALLEWAQVQRAIIIEDDYDGEFRYDAPPLPPLASLDGSGRVLYLGTFSKILSPALRLGFVVAAPDLVAALVRERFLTDGGPALAGQVALLHLLRSGDLDRHLRRARRWHAQVRQALTEELAPLAPHAVLGGIEAGLHVCLHLNPPLDAEDISARLAERQVYAETLTTFTFTGAPAQALVLGHGGLTLAEVRVGTHHLRQVITQALRDTTSANTL